MAIKNLIAVIKTLNVYLKLDNHSFIYGWSITLPHYLNCITFIVYVHLSYIKEQMVSIPAVLCPLAVIPLECKITLCLNLSEVYKGKMIVHLW